ncbi:MAG: PDZ domain-containing protein, partial [Rhizobacter sp.]|nr:PDZ domain-containing protein [Chlorobiales bacterium]
YEQGGDYRPEPKYFQGLLGAEINFDVVKNTYRITSIVRGDSWDEGKNSPLAAPGVGLKSGDVILAVNGQRASQDVSLGALLVNQAGNEVALTVASAVAGKGEADERIVRIKPLRDEQMLYYRAWVNRNTALVHSATGGKVGYVHVPNMGPWGYSEFFRAYLTESALDAMIVDVRFNGGGHVSQLLLEKLGRKRLGYDITRWAGAEPYPSYSILGPVVALTNEFAGSDGDIFSHCFKMMNLGTLIGKRTWGGVVGIHPRHALADGSITTQPEFSFWFHDVGWAVENYGTDPHIEVDLAPQDYAAGRDAQLERAIAEIQKQMQAAPPALPVFAARPNLALPKLPAA